MKTGILGAAQIADDGIPDPVKVLGHELVAARDRGRAEAFAAERGVAKCTPVQLLKSPGACVTAICTIENVELVKGLEAGKGTDYTAGDFTSPVCRPDRARTYGVCGRRR